MTGERAEQNRQMCSTNFQVEGEEEKEKKEEEEKKKFQETERRRKSAHELNNSMIQKGKV